MDKLKVILVDDEKDLLTLVSACLDQWGYGVIQAASGRQAIEIIKKDNPDIVILDYLMPDMDGLATLKELRKFDKEKPVIMFTAHPDTKAMKGAEQLNVSAFIPKLSIHTNAFAALKSALDMIKKELNREK